MVVLYDFEIAEAFYQIARLLNITGGDEHRAAAYYRAALALDGYGKRAYELARSGALESIPGVGKGVAGKVVQLLEEGHLPLLDTLRKQVPDWLSNLAPAKGIGPKTLSALYKLKLSSPFSFLDPEEGERIRARAAIPSKQWDVIKKALLTRETHAVQLAHADAIAEELIEWLHRKFAWRVEKTGALRRREEAVPQIELLVGASRLEPLRNRLKEFRLASTILPEDPGKWRVKTKLGIDTLLFIVTNKAEFSWQWLVTTGSAAHLAALADHARTAGKEFDFSIGLHRRPRGATGCLETEEQAYRQLGLSWVPPELRQGKNEVDLASRNELPKLVELKNIVSDLHMHTRWSDGIGTVSEMAEAAASLGYKYIAITDHSVSLRIANGLGVERLLRQIQEIRAWNKRHPELRVLTGIEVDILPDGSLDLPDHILRLLDWVVASIHSAMAQPEHQMMKRLEQAISNPLVDALGHPTGRLLGKPGHIFYHREPFAVSPEQLIELCAERGVGLEINCFPERMDLSSELAAKAARAGIPLHIGTDAHSPQHLQLMRYGVDVSRRAGLTRVNLLNCLSATQMQAATLWRGSIRARSARRQPRAERTGAMGLIWDRTPRNFNRFFRKHSALVAGRYRVVGIDLTGSKSRPSGWALLQKNYVSTNLLRTDDDLVEATVKESPDLVSIDSPLSLPKGRCCAREDCDCRRFGITRASERSLMTMRIGVFPCLLPSMKNLSLRGIALAKAFRERGIEVIESYPGAAQDILGISRKGKGQDLLLAGLRAFGIKLQKGSKLQHDELDAITSALVGYFWRTGQYLGLGIPEENELIVPRIPKFKEGDRNVVIGLSGLPAAGKTTVGQYLAFKYGFRYTRYSLLLRQMFADRAKSSEGLNLQEIGLEVHHSMGPEELTKRLIATMSEGENWVIDGLRHIGDFDTLSNHFGSRFHFIFIESTEKQRNRRVEQDPLRDASASKREYHPVEEEVPLLGFRTTVKVENNSSLKALFEQIDRLLGVR